MAFSGLASKSGEERHVDVEMWGNHNSKRASAQMKSTPLGWHKVASEKWDDPGRFSCMHKGGRSAGSYFFLRNLYDTPLWARV